MLGPGSDRNRAVAAYSLIGHEAWVRLKGYVAGDGARRPISRSNAYSRFSTAEAIGDAAEEPHRLKPTHYMYDVP
ncbi:MAG: hypothetical protein ACP5QI_07345 [Candidatus Bathyarchaeia archaeon]